MKAKKYLLDSVIIIDHLNTISLATDFIEKHHSQSVLSLITRAEVLTGYDQRGYKKILPLLDLFDTLPLEKKDADFSAQLRRQHGYKLHDALQASLAMNNDLLLVTRNTRDFKKQNFVHVPYTI